MWYWEVRPGETFTREAITAGIWFIDNCFIWFIGNCFCLIYFVYLIYFGYLIFPFLIVNSFKTGWKKAETWVENQGGTQRDIRNEEQVRLHCTRAGILLCCDSIGMYWNKCKCAWDKWFEWKEWGMWNYFWASELLRKLEWEHWNWRAGMGELEWENWNYLFSQSLNFSFSKSPSECLNKSWKLTDEFGWISERGYLCRPTSSTLVGVAPMCYYSGGSFGQLSELSQLFIYLPDSSPRDGW